MPNEPVNWELRELRGLIERNHADSREDILDLKAQIARDSAQHAEQMQRYLLLQVYEAREARLLERIGRLEEETRSSRAAVRAAVYTAVASVVASVLAGVVLAVIVGRGR